MKAEARNYLALAECIAPMLDVAQLARATAVLLQLGGEGSNRIDSERRRNEIERRRDERDVSHALAGEKEPG